MAMTKCIECGHGVSTVAKTCPNCGAVPQADGSSFFKSLTFGKALVLVFVALFFVVSFVIAPLEKSAQPKGPDAAPSVSTQDQFAKIGTPIESGMMIPANIRPSADRLQAAIGIIRLSGYVCNSVSSTSEAVISTDLEVICDRHRHKYTLHDRGGHVVVQVE